MDKTTIIAQMKEYLERFGYEYTDKGVEKVFETWNSQKAELLEKFRPHPNWDEENLAIVLNPTEYDIAFNKKAISDFRNWVGNNYQKAYTTKAIELKDPKQKKKYLQDLVDYIKEAKYSIEKYKQITGSEEEFSISIDENKINEELTKINSEVDEFNKYVRVTINGEYKYITREESAKINSAVNSISYIRDFCNDYILTEENANRINEYIDIHACAGQKISKVIGKICREVGIDKIKDIKIATSTHVDSATGEQVTEQREYDDGYNRQYQFMADGASPKKLKQITVISLNPMDYWGMSIGYKWSSCHTFDIHNTRNLPNSHSGMFSNGTMSYMLDKVSVIMYTLDIDKEGHIYHNEEKLRRCLFAINEKGTIILQSRVYPDGRDDGDQGLAKQYRGKMQLIVSKLWGLENKWVLKKGTNECTRYTETMSDVHYPDYIHYSDCNISVNKENKERPIIQIGSKPVCIRCGEQNTSRDRVICAPCRNGVKRGFVLELEEEQRRNEEQNEVNEAVADEVAENIEETINHHICNHCGSEIEDEDEMIEINGEYYCNEDCAHEAGYERCIDDDEWYDADDLYYCEDDGEWHNESNCYTDAYDGEYHSGEPEIETYDGNFYSCDDNAINDGYRQDYFTDEWYREDELQYDEYEGYWFDPDNDDVICTRDGEYFATADSAEHSSYYMEYFTDEWVHEDELAYDEYEERYFDPDNSSAICTEDGNYYSSTASAENAGYVYNDERGWITEEEAEEIEDEEGEIEVGA